MTRTISRSLSGVLEELELAQPTLVTSEDLGVLIAQQGIKSPVNVVASRLRERGWLLATPQRGVWEFAPAALAGPYSLNEPVTPLKAFLAKHPLARCGLTFQAAAWAHGIADRVPNRLEVAAVNHSAARQLPDALAGTVFTPKLSYLTLRGVPVLALESVLVHMAARPTAVRSWASALEWLPELSNELQIGPLLSEISGRSTTVQARVGYLLQSLRPDLATTIYERASVTTKTWFGPRGKLRRHDSKWLIADTLLPFDPRELGSIA